jgi:broad specificity phosphatase PhoE
MSRLLLVGHGATAGSRELLFGDAGPLVRPVGRLAERADFWVSGPEPACLATAEALSGRPPTERAGLAGCDFGAWAGRSLAEVAAADPVGVQQWLSDPEARPHDGETLAELVVRIKGALDAEAWPAGGSVAVVSSLVARAATVAALRAPASVIYRIDVGPLGGVGLSRTASEWRLQELRRSVSPSG